MSHEKIAGTFFQEYQKKNVMRLLKETVAKVMSQWLEAEPVSQAKLENLHTLLEMSIDSNTFREHPTLPDFITRLWLNPHQALDTLDKQISKIEVRNLIKEAASELELVNQQAPQY